MEIPSKYDPRSIEDKWYRHWLTNGHFKSVPDQRKAYAVVIPPPNVTGVLHMGHMLNNTIQDVLVRRARMQGFNACWVPGTDHASIATEAKVVAKLKSEGKRKEDLGRDGFLEEAWAWTHKHGGIILDQLKKLGASCDWDRVTFTMDEDYSEAVLRVFIELYDRGLIYRGHRMVNWDPEALTTVSDEEVIHKDVQSKLYYLRYAVEGTDQYVVVATTRPETILGDTAVCVHPEDERYTHLKGKKLIIPVVGRAIPVIFDEYVDREFGTGALKITPAHDVNDHELGKKHGLDTIDIFNANGTINELGMHYAGMDRFAARKQMAKELETKGLMEKVEDYSTSVGTSERTGAVIEPRLSLQWYVKMGELTKPALDAVLQGEVNLIPEKFLNTYRYWMEQGRDWCISRQLWWGHQIPAWHYGEGANDFVIALTAAEALEKAKVKLGNPQLTTDQLKQDPDTLDTWFSSWLWPMQVFNGVLDPENKEYQYYYPTADLVTAPEILFFWVARMIMAGYAFDGRKPFSNVYLHGIVRDKQGRKMSKSLGNSPDPIGLIEQYGADGVRVGMLLSAPAGNDILFDEDLCLQGRNFANKVWNAFRLVKGWETTPGAPQPAAAQAITWMDHRFNQALVELEDSFSKFRISEALMTTYRLVWDDFCSWYLEAIKPTYGQPIESDTLAAAERHFELVLKLLHPFMPFISEEIWHFLGNRTAGATLNQEAWPQAGGFEAAVMHDFDHARELVTAIRNLRNEKGLSPKETLTLRSASAEPIPNSELVLKLANTHAPVLGVQPEAGDYSLRVGAREYMVPLGSLVDVAAEREKLEKELDYQKGFLLSVDKKLSNERFVAGAPEAVIANERKKKADAEAKIALITEQLKRMEGEI